MSSQIAYGWEGGRRVPVVTYIDDDIEDGEPPAPERSGLDVLRLVVGMALGDRKPGLQLECVALVLGIGYDGASMAEIARRHRVTRAAVSKRCVSLCQDLGIPPACAMRSITNRALCRRSRLSALANQ